MPCNVQSLTLRAPHEPCIISAMTDWNFMTVIIVVALFLLWKLEFAATLLNLKAFPQKVPGELADVMDESKLDQGRSYLRENARFGIIKSVVDLTVLLVFWFSGGFEKPTTSLRLTVTSGDLSSNTLLSTTAAAYTSSSLLGL